MWKLQIPRRYKRNALNGDLYRSWRISSNFYHEKNEIRNVYLRAGYPMRFVNSVIDVFQSEEHDTMIPNYLFNYLESKPIVLKVVLF